MRISASHTYLTVGSLVQEETQWDLRMRNSGLKMRFPVMSLGKTRSQQVLATQEEWRGDFRCLVQTLRGVTELSDKNGLCK